MADAPRTNSGDPCPCCLHGTILVKRSVIVGENRVRTLRCSTCGFEPIQAKIVIPLKYAPPRRIRRDR